MRKEVLVSHTLLPVPHMYFCKQSKVCVFLKEKKQQLALAFQPTRLFFCAENFKLGIFLSSPLIENSFKLPFFLMTYFKYTKAG